MDADTEKLLKHILESSQGIVALFDLQNTLSKEIPDIRQKAMWLSGNGYLDRTSYQGFYSFVPTAKAERYFWPWYRSLMYDMGNHWIELCTLIFSGVIFILTLWGLFNGK